MSSPGTFSSLFTCTIPAEPILKVYSQRSSILQNPSPNHTPYPYAYLSITMTVSLQWGVAAGWGDRYGGVHERWQCSQLPWQIQSGCYWRFDFLKNVSNPPVKFRRVKCVDVLYEKSQCIRHDDYMYEHANFSNAPTADMGCLLPEDISVETQ